MLSETARASCRNYTDLQVLRCLRNDKADVRIETCQAVTWEWTTSLLLCGSAHVWKFLVRIALTTVCLRHARCIGEDAEIDTNRRSIDRSNMEVIMREGARLAWSGLIGVALSVSAAVTLAHDTQRDGFEAGTREITQPLLAAVAAIGLPCANPELRDFPHQDMPWPAAYIRSVEGHNIIALREGIREDAQRLRRILVHELLHCGLYEDRERRRQRHPLSLDPREEMWVQAMTDVVLKRLNEAGREGAA